jgi:hypothetical protein
MARQYGLPDDAAAKPSRSDPRGKAAHIRETAKKYGVDPEIALKVAKSEGLRDFFGDGGKSGGAFQLYTGGGLGNKFKKETGLDPLDPKNEDATIDYALREASKGGWGPWYGAAKVGVGKWDGIGGGGAASGGGTKTDAASGYGGIGSDTAASERAARVDTTTPETGVTTSPTATGAATGDFIDKLQDTKTGAAEGLSEAIKGLGQATASTGLANNNMYATTPVRATPVAAPAPPPQVAPMVDPRQAEQQRQQLALAMQRLNSGKLF